jgi:hypothetical protein
MRIRFQADCDLNDHVLRALLRREPTLDFQSAFDAGLGGLTDIQVLAAAAADSRVLVSHDKRTMPGHFANFIRNQRSSGVLIVSQEMALVDVVEELLLIWVASDSDEWMDRIVLPAALAHYSVFRFRVPDSGADSLQARSRKQLLTCGPLLSPLTRTVRQSLDSKAAAGNVLPASAEHMEENDLAVGLMSIDSTR